MTKYNSFEESVSDSDLLENGGLPDNISTSTVHSTSVSDFIKENGTEELEKVEQSFARINDLQHNY